MIARLKQTRAVASKILLSGGIFWALVFCAGLYLVFDGVRELGRNKGPYVITYEERDPEYVSRAEYQRYQSGQILLGVIVSGGLAGCFAYGRSKEREERDELSRRRIERLEHEAAMTPAERAKRDAQSTEFYDRLDATLAECDREAAEADRAQGRVV